MAESIRNVVTPLTLLLAEEREVPAIIYAMPLGSQRGAMQAELVAACQAVERAASAGPNWDGYGALVISEQTKENAIEGLEKVLAQAPVPDIAPNSNGTLSFQWEAEAGTAHLEVGQTRYSFYVRPRGGAAVLYSGPADQISQLHGTLLSCLLFPKDSAARSATPIDYPNYVRDTD